MLMQSHHLVKARALGVLCDFVFCCRCGSTASPAATVLSFFSYLLGNGRGVED